MYSSVSLVLTVAVGIGVGAIDGDPVETRSGDRPDTTVIRSKGDGKWGAPHDAIEVLRIGGERPETEFGRVDVIAAQPNGGVLVFEGGLGEDRVLRQFDSNGQFVRNIGRPGAGPGEYGRQPRVMVREDGSIIMFDYEHYRVNRYSVDGRFLGTFSVAAARSENSGFGPGPRGSIYVRRRAIRLASGSQMGPFIQFDSLGRVLDSLAEPTWFISSAADAYAPRQWSIPLEDGTILITRTDRLGFVLVDPARARPPLVAEVAALPPRYLPEERTELQRVQDFTGALKSRVPEFKQLATMLSFSDVNGRIWIQRSAVGMKVPPRVAARGEGGRPGPSVSYAEPPVFVAFLRDGTYLGEVRFPVTAAEPWPRISFVGSTAWAMVTGRDNALYLVKYRIYDERGG